MPVAGLTVHATIIIAGTITTVFVKRKKGFKTARSETTWRQFSPPWHYHSQQCPDLITTMRVLSPNNQTNLLWGLINISMLLHQSNCLGR